jgi:hypothetical protein
MSSTPDANAPSTRTEGSTNLASRIAATQALVDKYQVSPWHVWPIKKKDPERMKAYARLSARLIELEQLLPFSNKDTESPIASLLERITESMNRELVWDVAEQLKVTLLTISPAERLSPLLEAELALEKRSEEGAGDATARGKRSDAISWQAHFGNDELRELAKALKSPGADESKLRITRSHLAQLYEARIDHWRHERAFIELRTNYLHGISLLLGLVLVVFGVLVSRAGGPELWLWVACSAGALGAVFTGLFKVRDEMRSIRQLRSFSPILLAQPLVGATSAAVVFIAFQTGIVRLGGIAPEDLAWHHHAILGFLAGFSEAFLLGIVGRLAAATDEQPKATTARDQKA